MNEDLVELPFSTRLLFIGLWTLADREGRLADKPKQIRLAIFPADDVDVDKGLTELANAGFIERYEAKGDKYIQILNFTKHQSPHIKEAASTIPAPGKHRASTRRAALNPESKTESTSLNPHTDSTVRAFPELVNKLAPETQEYFNTVIDGIRSELGVQQLHNEPLWSEGIEWARANGFTAEHCLETFRLMRAQKWRTGPIKPETWAQNLPNLENLRREQNGTTKPTSEREKSAQRTINAELMADALGRGDEEAVRRILEGDGSDHRKGYLHG